MCNFAVNNVTQVRKKTYLDSHSSSSSLPPSHSEKRLYALDLARFIAMIMMMQGHTLDALVSPSILDTAVFPWNIWTYIRGLTAPVFLMVSGAVHVFVLKRQHDGSLKRSTVQRRLTWALTILGLGYLMMFPASRIVDLPFVSSKAWHYVLQVNILQLTGVSLLLLLVTAFFTRSNTRLGWASLSIALGIFLISPAIHALSLHEYLPLLLSNFVSFANGSLFPIFPYSGFLFMGVAIGAFLERHSVEERSTVIKKYGIRYGFLFWLAALLNEAFFQILLKESIPGPMSPTMMFSRIGFVLMFFSLCAVIIDKLALWKEHFVFFSGKSLGIYMIHLFLIFGTPWSFGLASFYAKQTSLELGIVLAIAVIFTTLGLIVLGTHIKERATGRSEKVLKYGIRTAITYLFLMGL